MPDFNWKMYADKLAYFFIAFAIVLVLRSVSDTARTPIPLELLYLSVAISLLASNVPRVMDLPLHAAYPLRCLELFSFGLAVVCFIVLCLRRFWI
jgi:hypothetical protein